MSTSGKYGQLVVISRSGADGKAFPMHTTRVVLRNLSENGTIVNTQILKAGQEQTLQSGDVITIVGRSLRYEENAGGEAATPQGPTRVVDGPQTVGGPSNGGDRRALVVFASGGGPDNRQLRRKLSRTPRNPETARKLKLWDAHYSGNAESPAATQAEDPFAPGDSSQQTGSFERMAQSVSRAEATPLVAAEVARIMDDISQMAAQSPLRTTLLSARKRPHSPEDLANGDMKVGAYGSEEETSRATVGVSPQSSYSRSPTLHRLRRAGSQAQIVSSLPRPISPAARMSPLKRTLSSSCAPPNDDDSEEVPTEPEPESDPEPAVTTPESRNGGRLVTQDSIARKSVRFGPALSPEVFDVAAPPSTPLRRGTPMQMARASSILRHQPTRPASPTLLIRSLLTPRPTRRQEMNRYFASLAESPAPAVKEEEKEEPKEEAEEAPAVDIASPTVLGASSADRRQRRRRSVGAAASSARRVTLDSPLRVPPPRESPGGSPAVLIVKKAAPALYLESPTKRPSLSAQRRERRRTAPALGSDLAASMAQMAAALGEDLPTLFVPKKPVEKPVDPIATEVVPDVAPLGLADAMQQEPQLEEDEEEVAEKEPPKSSSFVLLEQAERQARIQGSTPDASFCDALAEASKLAGLSVTSPPPTPVTFSAGRKHQRRQTMDDFAPMEMELSSVDEILAHRQRLKRIQDRKRRRQTVADLNKRRSSWRGWMPASGTLVDSPPSSPVASHVAHCPTTAKENEEEERTSSSLMYPPIAWNSGESPTKRRRMRDILGLGQRPPNSVELASETTQAAEAFAYPPKPLPIDAGWVEVERPGEAGELPLESVSAGVSQQVELFAVSAPASDIDTASLFSTEMPAEPPVVEEPVAVEEPPAVVKEPLAAVEKPAAVAEKPLARAVFSPPTTRGKATRQSQPPKPVANRPAIKRTAPRPPPPPPSRQLPTMTRKRTAEDPAPPPAKRGRGRPPNAVRRALPEASIISPPATRSSKQKPL
ncbi:hypothetical protein GGI18_000227 [Coemansia linderi]|uniref:Uncharacterized protein n=1 Tax=Coemansia linderi TaxID=2663919 RepID=A0ACC1KP65_9FUNG|nr:hypothetical protein GGI18_000227 [Coemansia linderi]